MPQCGALLVVLVAWAGLGWIVLGAGGMPVATDPAGAPSTGSANNGSRTHKCEHCTLQTLSCTRQSLACQWRFKLWISCVMHDCAIDHAGVQT